MTYKVQLEVFEGPLDLLLFLIKKEEVDIYDIPIARITEQYLEYLELMRILNLDIAGEFLVVAATLMQIKSRMLLPYDQLSEEEEEDPRLELVEQLLEYKKYKEAAERLREREQRQSDVFTRNIEENAFKSAIGAEPLLDVDLFSLLTAFSRVLKTISPDKVKEIEGEEVTVEEKMEEILSLLLPGSEISFQHLFSNTVRRFEVIVAFLAVLELVRLHQVNIRQKGQFGEIVVSLSEK